MSQSISISDAESLVMEVLWKSSPQTAEEVVAALESQQQWQEATIKTMLNRLLKKKAIRAEKDGRRYLYYPVLSRAQWVAGESTSLVDRLFGGRIAPLIASFGEQRKLSKRDIDELKRLVEELGDDK